MRTLFLLGVGALLASASLAHREAAPVNGALRFTSISAGGDHSCGITAEGAAYCWGRNEHGQLGDSSTVDRPAPVRVAGGGAFRVVTAGDRHTCAIDTDDAPYCWGSNDNGQLGIGSRSDRSYPTRIVGFRVTTISAGAQHTCATIIHWERQDRMVCWGSNSHRQLGTRESRDSWAPVPAFGTTRYRGVSAGSRHTCAVTKQGTIFCWGANGRGQLGNGSRTDSPVPFLIRLSRRATFVTVTTGSTHSCALTSEGEVYCWGENASGQVGTGKGGSSMIMPARLADTLRFTALSAGGDASCGVRRDGGVSCWGSNAAGQFGTGDTTGSRTPVPAVPGLALTAISVGRAHACGLHADGSAYCWGRLGSGLDASTTGPVLVSGQP